MERVHGMNLLIRKAHVVDPSSGVDGVRDVLIENGRIARVAESVRGTESIETIDGGGMKLFPGFVDLHTHLREPGQEHKETIATGTRAAVAGGYTSVCAMANTVPPNDERAVTEMIVAEAARNGACRVYPIGAVSKGLAGEALAEFADLRDAGCVALSDDGRPVMNSLLMRNALSYAQMLGLPVIAHEEDEHLSGKGVMHEGYISTVLGMEAIPAVAEESMTARDVMLAQLTGGILHIAHVSTIGAIESIRAGRSRGIRVTCEVTPHHLALFDEDVRSFSTNLKMKPPLRSRDHVEALVDAVVDGTIDAIATDHAPHHHDEKNVEFDLAPFGIIGLETAFSVCYEQLVLSGRIPLERLIELMSTRPAGIFRLPGGSLSEGANADAVLVDLDGSWTPAKFASRASNSPFTGRELRGVVRKTIVGGAVRYDKADQTARDAGAKVPTRRER